MAEKTEYNEVPVSISLNDIDRFKQENGTNSDKTNTVVSNHHLKDEMICDNVNNVTEESIKDKENWNIELQYIVYNKRWAMLFLFVMYSATNAFQWTELVIISNVIEKYYNVSTLTVTWTSMIYMVTYLSLIHI